MPLDTKLKGSDLFDSLDKEEEQEYKSFEVKNRSKSLNEVIQVYQEFIEKEPGRFITRLGSDMDFHDRQYHTTLNLVSPYSLNTEEVGEFAMLLGAYKYIKWFKYRTGYFLSALVNSSPDTDFVIDISRLDNTINNIGYRNTKNLIIHGNVGCLLGNYMESGTLEINGNVEGLARTIKGGNIYHKGKLIVENGRLVT